MKPYDIEWFDTWDNTSSYYEYGIKTNIFSQLRLIARTSGTRKDWAYSIKSSNQSNFRMATNGDVGITRDTLPCMIDPIEVNGFYENDSLGQLNYQWDFGNGITSNQRVNSVFYSTPGTYLVTLTVSNSTGFSDILKQYIVVPSCNTAQLRSQASSVISSVDENAVGVDISIYPNPNNGSFIVNIASDNIKNIYVYDLLGKEVYQKTNSSDKKFEIDITTQPKGIYVVKVIDGDNLKMFKVINQ